MTQQSLRAAVYLRISLDREMDGLAIDRQREACEKIASDRGWAVVEVYVDQSKSATDKTKKRPDYERMVADFPLDKFDPIVCWDLDRLTRQPRQLEDWIDAAEDRGLQLVTANGEADLATDGGRMYARIKAAVARGEVDRNLPDSPPPISNGPGKAGPRKEPAHLAMRPTATSSSTKRKPCESSLRPSRSRTVHPSPPSR